MENTVIQILSAQEFPHIATETISPLTELLRIKDTVPEKYSLPKVLKSFKISQLLADL